VVGRRQKPPTSVPQVDPYPTAVMASLGYAVLFPMPRGGAGYGEAGQRATVNAWGEGDYKDIMAGVDHLVAQGIADPDRLGVMGASYGGYMTNWIVTQTPRYKAASSGASLSDLSDTFSLSEGGEVHDRVFQAAMGEPRRLCGALAADLRGSCHHAALDSIGRRTLNAENVSS
jgi:dienelactone hydrolase